MLPSSQPKYTVALLGALILILGVGYTVFAKTVPKDSYSSYHAPMSYITNIVRETQVNENFRRVLFTGTKSQLVVMSIPPGGEIGEETHKYTEQTLFFLSGTGEATLNNEKFAIGPGDVVVVVPGTKHNFVNTGTDALKVYTVYAPPNHIDGRIHRTKLDADADTLDEAVGETAPTK